MEKQKKSVVKWLLKKENQTNYKQIDSISHWKSVLKERFTEWDNTIDRAIAFGFEADRVSYAFIAGFRAALQHLFPRLDPRLFASLCITEEGGNKPRAIKSSLEPGSNNNTNHFWILNGQKTFITGANEAEQIFVAASAGLDPNGRSRIKLVQLNRDLPGINIRPMAPLPFIPEIEHGQVSFTNVHVSSEDILPGDGYTEYIKPFRMIEEIHVMAAILGHLTRIALMYNWTQTVTERIIALVSLVKEIWRSDLSAAETHITFAGFSQILRKLIDDSENCWEKVPGDLKNSWIRDRAILDIAHDARVKRLENAWKVFK